MPKKSSIFFKQTGIYILIFFSAFLIMAGSVYYFCTDYYYGQKQSELKEHAQSIARQYGRSLSSGVINTGDLLRRMEILEDYNGESIFFLDSFGRVSAVSSSINSAWIGQSITNESV